AGATSIGDDDLVPGGWVDEVVVRWMSHPHLVFEAIAPRHPFSGSGEDQQRIGLCDYGQRCAGGGRPVRHDDVTNRTGQRYRRRRRLRADPPRAPGPYFVDATVERHPPGNLRFDHWIGQVDHDLIIIGAVSDRWPS